MAPFSYDLTFIPQDGTVWELRTLTIPDWRQKDSDLIALGYTRVSDYGFTRNGVRYRTTLWVK